MAADHVRTLRQHDLHVTAQRIAVLRAVSERPHGTTNELIDDVRRDIGAVSRQSVYDTLALLTDRDIIRRIEPAGSSARFENRVGDNHHHLICRNCDRVLDVDCATGEAPCLVPVDSGEFVVHEAEVVYWGICPTCQSHQHHNPIRRTSKESP
jgi:Fur family ferric uptake transcriptional regulator